MGLLINIIFGVIFAYILIRYFNYLNNEEKLKEQLREKKKDKIRINKISKYLYEKNRKEYPKLQKETKIRDKKWLCKSCDYKWESKKQFGEPSICPKCKREDIVKYSNTKNWEKEFSKNNKLSKEECINIATKYLEEPDCIFYDKYNIPKELSK